MLTTMKTGLVVLVSVLGLSLAVFTGKSLAADSSGLDLRDVMLLEDLINGVDVTADPHDLDGIEEDSRFFRFDRGFDRFDRRFDRFDRFERFDRFDRFDKEDD